MRKWIFLLVFFFCYSFSKSQSFNETEVDNRMLSIPPSQTFSTTAIAAYVKQNFDTDRKKLRAVYIWVASNIQYTTDSANVINLGPDPEAKVTASLRRRKGVCENFAAIFNEICNKAGLTSFIVDGYTKQNGSIDKTGHSWCAVFVDNKWLLCDPTWDVASGSNTKFFLAEPSEMIASHMPFDPMWQLLDHPVSHRQFYTGNTFQDRDTPLFNYADSIAAYSKMDSLQRFRATAFRIERSGLQNDLVKNRLEYNRMHIEIIREDKDVDLYNSSVADLNEATAIYNKYIRYFNDQFIPAISDKAMSTLLDGADTKIANAHKKLDEIENSVATFKFSTEDIRTQLNSLLKRVNAQKEFLTLYLATAKNNRQSLFFKEVSSAGKK
jgi:hypothetical protein